MNPDFAEYVARVLADAPPMTDEQAARISALFNTARPGSERITQEATASDSPTNGTPSSG